MLVRLVLNSRPQVIRPPWPPKCLDYRHEPQHPDNEKHFFVGTGYCFVAQAVLEFLSPSSPPTSASQENS